MIEEVSISSLKIILEDEVSAALREDMGVGSLNVPCPEEDKDEEETYIQDCQNAMVTMADSIAEAVYDMSRQNSDDGQGISPTEYKSPTEYNSAQFPNDRPAMLAGRLVGIDEIGIGVLRILIGTAVIAIAGHSGEALTSNIGADVAAAGAYAVGVAADKIAMQSSQKVKNFLEKEYYEILNSFGDFLTRPHAARGLE